MFAYPKNLFPFPRWQPIDDMYYDVRGRSIYIDVPANHIFIWRRNPQSPPVQEMPAFEWLQRNESIAVYLSGSTEWYEAEGKAVVFDRNEGSVASIDLQDGAAEQLRSTLRMEEMQPEIDVLEWLESVGQ